jgi:hypothetical protein
MRLQQLFVQVLTFFQTYAGVFKAIALFLEFSIGVGAYMAQVIILNAYTKIQTALTTAQADCYWIFGTSVEKTKYGHGYESNWCLYCGLLLLS